MSQSSAALHSTPQVTIVDEITAFGPWFHNLHLPDGTQTAPYHPLGDFPTSQWQQLRVHIPPDLRGWTVLDIGCNAGFYSFELAKRGGRVTGIDSDPRSIDQARWAARQYGLEDHMTFRQMQVYDLAHTAETFDLVLFMGVVYHLRYPTLALDIVAQRVARLLIFQPLVMAEKAVHERRDWGEAPQTTQLACRWLRRMASEESTGGDQPIGWIPNQTSIEPLLRASGLQITQTLDQEIYLCTPTPDC